MTLVICNKAEIYGCTINDCYHAVPHEEYSECKTKCHLHDDDEKCIEV